MLILPIQTEGHKQDAVLVVLDKDNIERMKQADPAEIELSRSGKHLVNPTIMVCYEEDVAALTRILHAGDLKAVIEYLQRGWKFRPDNGDHDRGPEKLKDQN